MKILTDLHCHTLVNPHAFSTIVENAQYAKTAGLEALAITDHSVKLPDSPHHYHFETLDLIPDDINGVRIFKGIELNILNKSGQIDMEDYILSGLDIVIASIHRPCYENLSDEDHTETYLNVLDNEYVNILGHTDSADLPYDLEPVLLKAKEKNILVEINNHHIKSEKNYQKAIEIAKRCRELEVGICVDSDAHICFDVANHKRAIGLLESIDFPEELIMNRNLEVLTEFLNKRKKF